MLTRSVLALAACGALRLEHGLQIDLARDHARATCLTINQSAVTGASKDVAWSSVDGTNLSFLGVTFDRLTWDQGTLTNGYFRGLRGRGRLTFRNARLNGVEITASTLAHVRFDGVDGGSWLVQDTTGGLFGLDAVRATGVHLVNGHFKELLVTHGHVQDLEVRRGHYDALTTDKAEVNQLGLFETTLGVAKLSATRITEASILGTTINRLRWSGGTAAGVHVADARLGAVELEGLSWLGGSFSHADFDALRTNDVGWTGTRFEQSRVGALNVRGGLMSGVVFDDVQVDVATFEGVQFTNSDLRGLRFGKATFVGCTYDRFTKLPPGPGAAGLTPTFK